VEGKDNERRRGNVGIEEKNNGKGRRVESKRFTSLALGMEIPDNK